MTVLFKQTLFTYTDTFVVKFFPTIHAALEQKTLMTLFPQPTYIDPIDLILCSPHWNRGLQVFPLKLLYWFMSLIDHLLQNKKSCFLRGLSGATYIHSESGERRDSSHSFTRHSTEVSTSPFCLVLLPFEFVFCREGYEVKQVRHGPLCLRNSCFLSLSTCTHRLRACSVYVHYLCFEFLCLSSFYKSQGSLKYNIKKRHEALQWLCMQSKWSKRINLPSKVSQTGQMRWYAPL